MHSRPGVVDEHSDALTIADAMTHGLLDVQAAVPSGGLGPELAGVETLRIEVDQASGMLAAQLDIGVLAEPFVCLRAGPTLRDTRSATSPVGVSTRRLRSEWPGLGADGSRVIGEAVGGGIGARDTFGPNVRRRG